MRQEVSTLNNSIVVQELEILSLCNQYIVGRLSWFYLIPTAYSLAILQNHGSLSMLAFLSSLPISVLRSLNIEANKFYDGSYQLYDLAL